MPVQVFVDESAGAEPGTGNHFVMASLIGQSEDWAAFSAEWDACLKSGPRYLDYFKMKEAAGRPSGQFHGWSETERDEKVRAFARIINKYAQRVIWSVIDLDAHAKLWAKMDKPRSEPYFWPFHNTILAACFTLWDEGHREQFDIIFDEQVVFGPRARFWYPVVQAIMRQREPQAATLLPADPLFRDDRHFLPLQAADLYAWTIRKATNDPSYRDFHWLLDELQSVKTSDYSQYYDFDRMKAVMDLSLQFVRDGAVPAEVVEKYREIWDLWGRR